MRKIQVTRWIKSFWSVLRELFWYFRKFNTQYTVEIFKLRSLEGLDSRDFIRRGKVAEIFCRVRLLWLYILCTRALGSRKISLSCRSLWSERWEVCDLSRDPRLGSCRWGVKLMTSVLLYTDGTTTEFYGHESSSVLRIFWRDAVGAVKFKMLPKLIVKSVKS